MKKILFLSVLWILCRPVFAIESYAVERADGGVSIVHYYENSSDTLDKVLKDVGLEGRPFRRVQASDLPQTREDRNFWTLQGGKVVVDAAKKQAAEDAEAAKEAEREAVLEKLKISKEEFEKLTDKESKQGIGVVNG